MSNLKKTTCKFGLLIGVSLTLGVSPAFAGYSGDLEVQFVGLNSSKGQVCLNLFNGSKGFPDGGRGASLAAARCTSVKKGSARVVFTNLPYGNYAISAVHDTNGDTRMNSNILGIPTEGIGFSNNPTVQNAAPSYSESQFLLTNKKSTMQIRMQYF